MTRFRHAAIIAVLTLPLVLPKPAAAQWAVIDESNLAQNIIQSARLLTEINNQIQSLQNEAVMLQNEAKNLTSLNFSSLPGITGDLQQIGSLMNEAQGVQFNVQSVETVFGQFYPHSYPSGTGIPQLVGEAQTRWEDAQDSYQQTMLVQSQIAETVQNDTSQLAALVNASQGAVGNLQAQQATNQLLALSIKQQLQIQTLMAAQGRADALKIANDGEAEEEGSAAFSTFLGSNQAYTQQ